jgi:segregation and condensation protein B
VRFMADISPPHPERPPEQGVSLSELTEAFAQAMGGPAKPEAKPEDVSEVPGGESESADRAESVPPDQSAPTDPSGDPSERAVELDTRGDDDDSCALSPKTILEAMLFVGNLENEPLSARKAAELMRGVDSGEIPELIKELNQRYGDNGCPYSIVSEGAGYRMALRREFHPVRNKFYGRVREARLSQAAKEVLAIVAYRQPLTSEQMTTLRGTPSGHLLTQLVRRRLLRVERQPGKRRVVLYRTTDRFLELFGLENLEDLPRSEELVTGDI